MKIMNDFYLSHEICTLISELNMHMMRSCDYDAALHSIYKSKYAVCKWTLCVSGSVTTYETDGEEDDVPDTPEPPPPYPPHGTGRKPG